MAQEAFATNTLGPWRIAQAFLPLLRRAEWGRIVNVSSEAGSLASMGSSAPAYSTSKAALNAFTRLLAAELRDTGILHILTTSAGYSGSALKGRKKKLKKDQASPNLRRLVAL